ncbi:MAG: anti-sigma factor domain-containing protein [Clostridia bacterium]|nr:anti-sigma factor domain-containing protein [Clostridia bacterium]
MRANKGKIMEILESHAVVMTSDGHFNRIKRKDSMRIGADVIYTSGDLVEKPSSKKGWVFGLKAQVAVATFVLLTLVMSQIAMPAAYAVVSLDINPSLQITVDESRKVVGIDPMNTEADELLEAYVLNEDKDLHAVINELIKLSNAMGYLTNENHNVILATAMVDRKNSKSGSDELMTEILDVIEETEYTFDFTLVSTVREASELKNAKSEGLSLGRYAMAKENFLPPGQEKKIEEPVEIEPVALDAEPQIEEEEKPTLPPGQEKKVEESKNIDNEKPVPPGQAIKEQNTPSKFVITEKKAASPNDNKGNGKNKGGGKGN